MREGTAIVVLAKLPGAGDPKTRLAEVLTREQRSDLQAALLRDALEKAASAGAAYLAFTPPEATAEAEAYARARAFPQVGADLGERMARAVERALAIGHAGAIVIGTDCPSLLVADLRRAVAILRHADVCLGPALDGGYYLIGLRRPHRGVFADVPWSSPRTLAVTLERVTGLGLSHHLLRQLPDLDTPTDLFALSRASREGEAWEAGAPRLRALLRSWPPATGVSGSGRGASTERQFERGRCGSDNNRCWLPAESETQNEHREDEQ